MAGVLPSIYDRIGTIFKYTKCMQFAPDKNVSLYYLSYPFTIFIPIVYVAVSFSTCVPLHFGNIGQKTFVFFIEQKRVKIIIYWVYVDIILF